jgi:hypothetical protein
MIIERARWCPRPRPANRLARWCARYLPAELAGTAAAVAAAVTVTAGGGNRAVAAGAASGAEVVAFYAVMAIGQWRRLRADVAGAGRPGLRADVAGAGRRGLRVGAGRRRTVLRLARDLVAEFGPAELGDSLLLRPTAMAAGTVLTGSPAAGTLLGKLAADLVFYAVAIASRALLLRQDRPPVRTARPSARPSEPAARPD